MQKMQRDMAERGHSLESIQASIEARKPDFDAYIGNSLICICAVSQHRNKNEHERA